MCVQQAKKEKYILTRPVQN